MRGFFSGLLRLGKVGVHIAAGCRTANARHKADDYLMVAKAAGLPDVSPNSARNWGYAGLVEECRHPVNNYRIFKRKDLERLRKKLIAAAPRRVKPR